MKVRHVHYSPLGSHGSLFRGVLLCAGGVLVLGVLQQSGAGLCLGLETSAP